MTLVVTINGPETIWLLADRRLSNGRRIVKEDARKVMFLETTEDGVAILGYAGLGSTARGTEPADWMSAVLRGRKLPIEECLGILAEAMKRQFPRHLSALSCDHLVVVPAFVGNEARLYTIDLTLTPDRTSASFDFRRWVAPSPAKASPPRFGITGSGALELLKDKDKKWARELLRVVRANDRRQVSPLAVADQLAKLNYEVYRRHESGPVGRRCIVAWRHRRGGVHQGGGGQQFYTGTTRDRDSTSLPAIVNGMDLNAIIDVMTPHMNRMMESMVTGKPTEAFDKNEINAEMARRPHEPDEDLP